MPRPGYQAITLRDEAVALVDAIAKKQPYRISRSAIVERAIERLAEAEGVKKPR